MFSESKAELTIFDKLRSINYFLLFLICTIFFIGTLALYSISNGNFSEWPIKHLQRFILGLIIFFIVALLDLKIIFRFAYLIFIASIAALIILLIVGDEINGAKRWISFAGFSLQPSEFVKYTLILALAKYFHSMEDYHENFISKLIIPSFIVIIPVAFVVIQPDLGTALVIFLGGVSVIWISGLNYKYFISGILGFILSLPILWQYLKEYQKDRVFTFFNPERDPLGNGYHIMQSKIALGSGGFSGKGFLEGTQSHLNFLPEMHTDFIFTMYGEEFGFIGTFLLLIIYLSIILVSFNLAVKSRSSFGKYVSCGLIFLFFSHVFINIGMVMGLLPVVGVPLPLISYGGSSMLATMVGFGLIMNCYINRDIILAKEGLID